MPISHTWSLALLKPAAAVRSSVDKIWWVGKLLPQNQDDFFKSSFFVYASEFGQLGAVWQSCLRYMRIRDSHCCYATTIANQISSAQTNLAADI